MEMAKAIAILALLLVSPTAYAMDFTVGDNSGWATSVNYVTWASNKSFTTDDTLVFNYVPPHTVDVVLEEDYNNCTTLNITSSNSPGPTNITLNATGTWYFICSVPNHCTLGQKLAINVTAGTGNSTPSSPAAPPPADGSVPSTPAATSPGTPPSTATPTPSVAATLDGGNCLMVGLMSLVLMTIVGVMG